jgi:hypothetical protein
MRILKQDLVQSGELGRQNKEGGGGRARIRKSDFRVGRLGDSYGDCGQRSGN